MKSSENVNDGFLREYYMGKRFDAELITGFFDAMGEAYIAYGSEIDHAQLSCADFADNDTFVGMQADGTKEMVGVAEIGLMEGILRVNDKIKDAQVAIMEQFESTVDAASNARIDEEILDGINHDLIGYHQTFDATGIRVERIHARLSPFSKYLGRDFTIPRFNQGRVASEELCGGDSGKGFIQKSVLKLRSFDLEALAMLKGMMIGSAISDLARRLLNSSLAMNAFSMFKSRGQRTPLSNILTANRMTRFERDRSEQSVAEGTNQIIKMSQDGDTYTYETSNGNRLILHEGEAVRPRWEVYSDYDNDFAYDPDAKATLSDYYNWTYWGIMDFGGNVIKPDILKDALETYEYYRYGDGSDYHIDYEKAYREDDTIRQVIDSYLADTQYAVNDMIASGKEPPFSITSELLPVRQPCTENWQKAIGAHQAWISADVTIEDGNIVMKTTVHELDRYNFNRGMSDIATGAKDDSNGRFEELGWANSFTTYGEAEFTQSWNPDSYQGITTNDTNAEFETETGRLERNG